VLPINTQAMAPAHFPQADQTLGSTDDRQTMGRIAAGIWAAIAFFGAIATVKPLRFPDTDVTAMRLVVFAAVAIAAISFFLPWKRMPKRLFDVVLVLMSLHIGALAWASGAVHSEVTMGLTLAIAFAVCFLPVRTSVAQVGLIAVLLAAGLILIDKENAQIEALRTTLLLAVLVVLCGLVLILRAVMAERDAQLRRGQAFQSGLLDERHLSRLLDREISRAARHARPLSVVLLDVSGPPVDGSDGPRTDRLVTMLARSILGRIRIEDSAGHMGKLRFAVVTPETDAAGAASISETVADVVRRRLVTLGFEPDAFDIAVGWADFPHRAQSRAGLLAAAVADLDAAILRNETAPARAGREHAPSSGYPATAGPSHNL
jgi:GGDEF domain-containing protein